MIASRGYQRLTCSDCGAGYGGNFLGFVADRRCDACRRRRPVATPGASRATLAPSGAQGKAPVPPGRSRDVATDVALNRIQWGGFPDQDRTWHAAHTRQQCEAYVQSIADAIREHGREVVPPIVVFGTQAGFRNELWLMDGRHRTVAHRILGLPMIRALVR